jgi:hypothetical protein
MSEIDLSDRSDLYPWHMPPPPETAAMDEPRRDYSVGDPVRPGWHERLAAVHIRRATDFAPSGYRPRDGLDCSCGCIWFCELAGNVGMDWGVCGNPRSPRAGLLTFEHDGCEWFTPMEEEEAT